MPKLNLKEHLRYLNVSEVQKITRAWGDKRPGRKEECLDYLAQSLDWPEQIRATLAECNAFELTALAMLKQAGGVSDSESLPVMALLSGQSASAKNRYADESLPYLLLSLLEKGLLFTTHPVSQYQGGYTSVLHHRWSGALPVCSDDRILQQIENLQPNDPRTPRLEVETLPHPSRTLLRRPQGVALSHLAFLRAMHDAGELKINKGNERAITAASLNKLGKKLEKQGWRNDASFTVDGVGLPMPLNLYTIAARNAGWFKLNPDTSTLSPAFSAEQFSAQSFAEQTRLLVSGLMDSPDNLERGVKADEFQFSFSHIRTSRRMLMTALALLPQSTHEFVSISSFSQALFNRIGLYFSINGPPSQPYNLRYGKPIPEERQRELTQWVKQAQKDWGKNDEPWIVAALSTWLCAWGIVEIGLDEAGALISFRLTNTGRNVLGISGEAEMPEAQTDSSTAWVVQPNFDVLVYLEQVTSGQLAFIESYAVRTSANQHTAHYRLTRESVYGALEQGGELETLLQRLSAGASQPLPPNVARELQDWAARREQLTLRQFTRIIEFADAEARAQAIQKGQAGTAIGERFLRIEGKATPGLGSRLGFINYAQPLPPCLSANEDGEINLDAATRDLLIEAQLGTWAEREGAAWRLTAHSVRAALRQGLGLNQLMALFETRLKGRLPPLLHVALQAWGGEDDEIELEKAIVVRCHDEATLRAIVNSARFKRCIRGTLAPNIALVKPDKLDEFKEHLKWAGLKPCNFQ